MKKLKYTLPLAALLVFTAALAMTLRPVRSQGNALRRPHVSAVAPAETAPAVAPPAPAPPIPVPVVTFSHAQMTTTGSSGQVAIPAPNSCSSTRFAARELVLVLDMGDDYTLGAATNLASTVTVSAELQNSSDAVIAGAPKWAVDLRTATGRPEEQVRIDLAGALGSYPAATRILLKVTGYTPPVATVQPKIRLRGYMNTQVLSGATSATSPTTALLTPKEPDLTRHPAVLSWTSNCINLPNFELQILRLYNIAPPSPTYPYGSSERDIMTKIDWSKALSIETGSPLNMFQLFPAEGTGYYIWRVRPIGNLEAGGIANPLNWGVWCGATPAGTMVNVNATLDGQYPNIFFYTDPSDGRNRVYSRIFHEGDRTRNAILEQMQFADGNSRVVQEQTRLESNGNVLVRQHVYDQLGRESFVSMGAPLQNPSGLAYINAPLASDAGGTVPYSYANYGTPAKLDNPDRVTGKVVDYYDKSTDPGISSTEGYPFSLNRYYNEPTQRTYQSSSPGMALRPGAKTENYAYCPATEGELVRVFGDEAPSAGRVYKLVVTNPDSVSQVSYFEGEHLIATCLLAANSSPYDPVTENGMAPVTMNDTLRGNGNPERREAHTLVLKGRQTIQFKYYLKPATYAEACSQICEGCSLTAEVTIRNLRTTALVDRKTFVIPPMACGASLTPFQQSWSSPSLAAGEYVVEKRLYGTPPANGALAQPEAKIAAWQASLDATAAPKWTLLNGFLNQGKVYALYAKLQADGYAKTPDGKAYLVPIDGCLKLRVPILACDTVACDGTYDLEGYATSRGVDRAKFGQGYTTAGTLNAKARALANAGMACNTIWNCWKSAVASVGALDALSADAADAQYENWNWPVQRLAPPAYATNLSKQWLICLGQVPSDPRAICAKDSANRTVFEACIKANSPTVTVSEAEAGTVKAQMESACNSACESRRTALYGEVVAAYLASGYTWSGNDLRNTAGVTVTTMQVLCMVEGIIADCKAGCGTSFTRDTNGKITGLQPTDRARFTGAMSKVVELSIATPCSTGFRSIAGNSWQVPSLAPQKLSEMNAAFEAFRRANPSGGTFSLSPWVSTGCSTTVAAQATPNFDLKNPYRKGAAQYFVIRNCQLLLRTESQLGTSDVVVCANICATQSCGGICYRWKDLPVPQATFTLPDCQAQLAADVRATLDAQYAAYKAEKAAQVRQNHRNSCLVGITDYVSMGWTASLFHYTLRYHDRAGRLVKTVSPQGVAYLDMGVAANAQRKTRPAHTFVTEYAYNTLGQMVKQRTPDGGMRQFWYDGAGRMRFSQDDHQLSRGEYSFVKYDALGRVIESGASKQSATALAAQVNVAAFPDRLQAVEWTRMVYTTPATLTGGLGKPQRYLLNRISYTENSDKSLTAYSYDPHGNVEWIHYAMDGVAAKTLEFSYDLLSGKVTEYVLNGNAPNPLERFRQRIAYDAENRPVELKSSREGMIWETEAKYVYYAHGPLKRMEVGEDKLQGLDFGYTVQGMLKGLNTHNLTAANDPGRDGTNLFAPDAFGYQLDYYAGDFVKASGNIYTPLALAGKKNYYTGMIGGMASETQAVTGLTRTQVAETYAYDLVGRLTATNMHNRSGASTFTQTADFGTTYSYDANGNLLGLGRKGAGAASMDALAYKYETVGGKPSNRLDYIDDGVAEGQSTLDIDDQAADNYGYDARGRLTRDTKGGITAIEWTASDQVRSIVKANGTRIDYRYDPQGRRQRKTVTLSGGIPISYHYLTGPNGNTLAIYKQVGTALPSLTEVPIGEAGKLGNYTSPTANPGTGRNAGLKYDWRQLGSRQYVLSDHLGNVRAVIADSKEPQAAGGFKATLLGATNYYAYGMPMPGQNVTGAYRYGYNGMEKDNEVYGEGNEYTTEFRQYDPRVGRWMSLDPKAPKYEGISPYNAMNDDPISYTDLKGDDPKKIFLIYNQYQMHSDEPEYNEAVDKHLGRGGYQRRTIEMPDDNPPTAHDEIARDVESFAFGNEEKIQGVVLHSHHGNPYIFDGDKAREVIRNLGMALQNIRLGDPKKLDEHAFVWIIACNCNQLPSGNKEGYETELIEAAKQSGVPFVIPQGYIQRHEEGFIQSGSGWKIVFPNGDILSIPNSVSKQDYTATGISKEDILEVINLHRLGKPGEHERQRQWEGPYERRGKAKGAPDTYGTQPSE